MKKNKPFVAISDFHSNSAAMNNVKKYIAEGYNVFILGDATDRGPKNDGTGGLDMLLEIKKLEESGKVIYIPGNHDEFLYTYSIIDDEKLKNFYRRCLIRNGGRKTCSDIATLKIEEPRKFDELINWLGNLPLQRVYNYDGQEYCFAHALFNQDIYKTNPEFSLSDIYKIIEKNKNPNDAYRELNILWFRKEKDKYNPYELPSKDDIMVVGHTPQEKNYEENFDLINNKGETIRVMNVDGGLYYGHDYMFEYKGKENRRPVPTKLLNIEQDKEEKDAHQDLANDEVIEENNLNNRVRRVDRKKSSSIVTGVINSSLSNIKSIASDIQGVAKENLSKINEKRNATTKEQNEEETLKYRVIESIKHPTKKMLAIATITLSLIVGSISLSTCSKNPSKVNVATTESEQNGMEYTVREGDTLSKIASKYNVTLDELVQYNDIDDPNNITIGMTILIPSVNMIEYTVREGDTLSEIAIKYNTDIETIIEDNNIEDSNSIRVGTILKIRTTTNTVGLNFKTRVRRKI